jgi:hypothetical protein
MRLRLFGPSGLIAETKTVTRTVEIRPAWEYTVTDLVGLLQSGAAGLVADSELKGGRRSGWVQKVGGGSIGEWEQVEGSLVVEYAEVTGEDG